jgi:hypothetical protein
MAVHLLGIRHHGPGSARNVQQYLQALKPDIVLVEGPPEADELLRYMGHAELKPPVAILVYQTVALQQAVYYPFAEFSPEWQAIHYAKKAGIPVRFMDLPLTHVMAIKEDEVERKTRSPLQELAAAAGFEQEDRWWEIMIEHRQENVSIFEAVQEAMTALREEQPTPSEKMEQLREAWMRKLIRQAEKEMYTEIAVICGAWHVPALANMPKQKEDNELLKGLPKVKVETTWIPWTYDRLSLYSGYGAGIESPGWYDHVWNHPTDDGSLWLSKVARLFREHQRDVSVAHVIESVRLATTLASLRNLSKAGLTELNEATLSVFCNGEEILMQLIHEQLTVSNRIGSVPDEIPKPPLQVDIEKIQKRLRLPASADWKDYMLDLRKENDLERSIYLHRLELLGIPWGQKSLVSGKGTFKEQWRLQWDPSFILNIIEKGVWGNTLEEACNAWLVHRCKEEKSLQAIAALLEQVIPADLSGAANAIAERIQNLAAATNDIIELVAVLPGLARIIRYGNVRKTDAELVRHIVESMITRICIGLPLACAGIDEETTRKLTDDCNSINHSIHLLQEPEYVMEWHVCLEKITWMQQAAPMMRGFATRQLMDAKKLEKETLNRLFYSSLSRALPVADTSAWLEGFLQGSGTLLLLDENLWGIVHEWVQQIPEEDFVQALPLLRRTFSQFTHAERRKLGEKLKQGGKPGVLMQEAVAGINREAGKQAIPVVMELLGYPKTN